MGIHGFTNEDVLRMEVEKADLLEQIRQLRESNDTLKNAADRVLKATSSMELEYAHEALYEAINGA